MIFLSPYLLAIYTEVFIDQMIQSLEFAPSPWWEREASQGMGAEIK